jgi:hypothetical protein
MAAEDARLSQIETSKSVLVPTLDPSMISGHNHDSR